MPDSRAACTLPSALQAAPPRQMAQQAAYLRRRAPCQQRAHRSRSARRVGLPQTPGQRGRRPTALHAQPPGRTPPRITKLSNRKGMKDFLQISLLFACWYSCNIYFNIFNKQVRNLRKTRITQQGMVHVDAIHCMCCYNRESTFCRVYAARVLPAGAPSCSRVQVLTSFGHAAMCTWLHLVIGSVLAALLWLLRVRARPTLSPRVIDIIFPLAILHAIGFYTTNASLGAVAVSLTHTIKSMEPFFTVVLSWALMRARPAKRVLAALVPIVVGVVIASATDISFNWLGFCAAMASNLAFQARNVLSKKAMLRTSFESLEGGMTDISALDEVNIFALMSMGAALLMLPFVLTFELPSLLAVSATPVGWMPAALWLKTCLAGVCRCAPGVLRIRRGSACAAATLRRLLRHLEPA